MFEGYGCFDFTKKLCLQVQMADIIQQKLN